MRSRKFIKFVHRMSFVTYGLKRAYLLIILALEASNWLQITFYMLTNVLTSVFERFGPNSWANIRFQVTMTVILVGKGVDRKKHLYTNALIIWLLLVVIISYFVALLDRYFWMLPVGHLIKFAAHKLYICTYYDYQLSKARQSLVTSFKC